MKSPKKKIKNKPVKKHRRHPPSRKINGFLKVNNTKEKFRLLGKECVKCGSKKNPSIDHITPVIDIIQKYGYINRVDAHKNKDKYPRQFESMKAEINDIGNFRILCMTCHTEHTKEHNKKLARTPNKIYPKMLLTQKPVLIELGVMNFVYTKKYNIKMKNN